MKRNKSPQEEIPASVSAVAGPIGLNGSTKILAASSEEVARLAYTIYQNQGSQPGHEVKHWLAAESRLIEGTHRETQMHPVSSLLTAEH